MSEANVHHGNYRFECRHCDEVADIPATSLSDSKRQARSMGWSAGRGLCDDTCPACNESRRARGLAKADPAGQEAR